MVFTKRLREGVRRGDITCSIRIWMHPHVKVGGRYPMEEGEIEVDSIQSIDFEAITDQLIRESGFPDLARCSRWRNTAVEKISIWSGFTTCREAG
jgi:hypothetical protein